MLQINLSTIDMKGMTFDHDFGSSFSLFSSLLKNREKEKDNELAKIVIKSHPFLLDPIYLCLYRYIYLLICLSMKRKLICNYNEYV